jgi:hypothetical protein
LRLPALALAGGVSWRLAARTADFAFIGSWNADRAAAKSVL